MNKRSSVLIVVAALLAAVACKKPAVSAEAAAASKGWSVFKDGKVVQWIDDKPGRLSSRAIPRPGTPVVTHPFITATSKDVMSEGELYNYLKESKSFADYVDHLRKNGYTVKPATETDED